MDQSQLVRLSSGSLALASKVWLLPTYRDTDAEVGVTLDTEGARFEIAGAGAISGAL